MTMRTETIKKKLLLKAQRQREDLQETLDHIAWLESREGKVKPVLDLKSAGVEESA